MPRAPRATLGETQRQPSSEYQHALRDYRAAWQATMQLLREGRSFSGHERNCVFLNSRGPQFANGSSLTGLNFDDDARAIGVTDWDLDGDLDLWLANRTGPRLRFMMNQLRTSSTATEQTPRKEAFLALRLRGTTSNRDAIGARVALTPMTGALTPSLPAQTVTAGDAFLSQSSKWLHFGLPTEPTTWSANVRWPSGREERFTGLTNDHRYVLTEGTGVVQAWDIGPRQLALRHGTQPTHRSDDTARIYLANRIPVPLLPYRDAQHTLQTQLPTTAHRPLLVVLWASWCQPCVHELQTLIGKQGALQAAGVDVLALTLDGLDTTQPTQPIDAQRLLAQLHYPFMQGEATPELLEKLSIAQDLLLNRAPPLAVPMSFLVDGEGRLALIYRGPVSWTRLEQDIQSLARPWRERRDAATSFAGRWANPPRLLLLRAVAKSFQERAFEDDYQRYLQLDADTIRAQRAMAASDEQRQELDRQFAATYYNLGLTQLAQGDTVLAREQFEQAIEFNPRHADALVNLGVLLAKEQRSDEAINRFTQAVAVADDSIPARQNLAAALTARGRFAEATAHYRRWTELAPASSNAYLLLGRALLEQGEQANAAAAFTTVLQLDPHDRRALVCLAWLEATASDSTLRQGDRAVAHAQALREATGANDPMMLDLLAAAHAEQGNFAAALETIDAALRLVGNRSPSLRNVLQQRRTLYAKQQPFRDPDGKYP